MNNTAFTTFPSPAKLNLFLHITGQRANGYHDLQTVFQFIDLYDDIHIRTTQKSDIELLTPIAGVANKDNLIVKAAELLKKSSGCSLGAEIKIDKILPMGGGLGGGSSNAATILLALNALWQTNLSSTELAKLGLTLGADVPIFIHGYAAFAEGIGEHLTPVSPTEYWYLITRPDCSISTVEVFQSEGLTRNTPKISVDDFDIDLCHNDCQTLVIKHYPKVAKLLAWLVEYAPSRMTGTGACIFSRFPTENEARLIQSQLPDDVSSFVAKGLNQSPLHKVLSALDVR